MGAIAFEKNDCNFPQRSDDNRDESKNNHGKSHDDFERDEAVTSNPKKTGDYVGRYRYAKKPKGDRFCLTGSFRNGPTHVRHTEITREKKILTFRTDRLAEW